MRARRETVADSAYHPQSGPERLDIKIPLIASLDRHLPSHVPLASSSSGLPASSFIRDCRSSPSRVLIGHPFNPPHVMPLVEIVPHPGTSAATVAAAKAFYDSLGRRPIVIRKEVPGFLANRLQIAVVQEAISLVARGVVSPEDVDAAVMGSLGPRWALIGPMMSWCLGGGGNPGGFERMNNGIGAAAGRWVEDMRQNAIDMDDNGALEKVNKAFEEGRLGQVDSKKLTMNRDHATIELLQSRAKRSDLEGYAQQ